MPTNQLTALTTWVEKGTAPAALTATKVDSHGIVVESRPVCRYPLVARYDGRGSPNDAASFHCAR